MATPRLLLLSRRLTTVTTTVTSSLISRSLSSAAIPPPQFSLLHALSAVQLPLMTRSSPRLFSTHHAPMLDDCEKKTPFNYEGCDFEHWLIITDPPPKDWSRDQIIDSYVKTLAQVTGSEEEARMKIYSVSTKHYFGFGALISEEVSNKFREMEKVRWVLPDSYLDVKNKDYGGEPFINGQAVPYDPKYHAEWVRNNNQTRSRPRPRYIKRCNHDHELNEGYQSQNVPVFKEPYKTRAYNQLVAQNLPKETMDRCVTILECVFKSGRRFDITWYDSSPAFSFFKKAIEVQKWNELLPMATPVYVSELVQFYATVEVNLAEGCLSAVINGKPFVLTIAQLADILKIPTQGLSRFPKGEWETVDNITPLQVTKALNPKATSPYILEAGDLTNSHRFFHNFVFRVLAPNNDNRGRCSILQMFLIYHLSHHLPINLPALMFHHINELARTFKGDAKESTVVPYGSWLSYIFELSDVVDPKTVAVEKLSDVMNEVVLSKMFLEVRDNQLVRRSTPNTDHS